MAWVRPWRSRFFAPSPGQSGVLLLQQLLHGRARRHGEAPVVVVRAGQREVEDVEEGQDNCRVD